MVRETLELWNEYDNLFAETLLYVTVVCEICLINLIFGDAWSDFAPRLVQFRDIDIDCDAATQKQMFKIIYLK